MFPAVPDFSRLSQYSVNRDGEWEGIKWSLYDSAVYPIAGASVLNFFQSPIGTAGKTESDTNMVLPGSLPANQMFLCTSVEVQFWPVRPAVAAQNPANFSALTAGLLAQGLVNDQFIFRRGGNLNFVIGSKPYLTVGPMMEFPSKQYFELDAAIGLTGDSDLTEAVSMKSVFADCCGRPFMLDPANLLLPPNQNFNLSLNWPEGVQAITTAAGGSNAPGRVFVVLDGFLYRKAQ